MDRMASVQVKARRGRRSVLRDGPDPVDVHVGSRIHLRRTLLGMSQSELAQGLGLSFQQLQKYERGMNRASASALYRIAETLLVPVSFFFEGLDAASPVPEALDISLASRENLVLLKNYHTLPEPVRKQVYALLSCLDQGMGRAGTD